MRRVVIDTNILVSSVLSPKGKPAEVMNLCLSGKLQVFYTEKIFDEYKKVLSYKRLNISLETQKGIVDAIAEAGILINPTPSHITFIDESDRVFYDTARASEATLITGNIKHFPTEHTVMTPADFLTLISQV